MPDNELDELADNFFCHLHDHNHNDACEESHSHESTNETAAEDLTNILNPLRDTSKLRKSILVNSTLFMLTNNHIDHESIKVEENLAIKCSTCKFNLGYKGISLFFV